jgi:L-iditol 2-dehydrogenase
MKAMPLTALRRLELLERPKPQIRVDTDVLLKVERVGVCGSDMHYFETGRIASRAAQFPFVLGHECAGTVVEIGAGVARIKPGDQVAVDPAMSCFTCDQCRADRPHTCRKLRFLGCPGEAEGCLSEFIVMPEASLYPVTGRLTLEQAALCEPLSIGLYAVRLSELKPGMDIGILGSGPIGLCVFLAARQAGANAVFMTDRIDDRVRFAARAGVAWTGNPDHEPMVKNILGRQPAGLDMVFECAGQQETLDQALELLKPGGKIVIVGIPREDRVSFHIDSLRRKEITVVNVRRQNHCVQLAVDLIAAGQIKADFLVTHRFDLAQAQEAFELVGAYREGVIKAMIQV